MGDFLIPAGTESLVKDTRAGAEDDLPGLSRHRQG
jgi:hypothetical protein